MRSPKQRFVFLIVAFLTILSTVTSCSNLYKEVTVDSVDKVVIRRMNDMSIILTAEIKMNNPNGFDVTIKNSDLKVISNNKILGVADILEEVHIPGNSNEYHRFIIETKYSKMVLENLQLVMSLAMQDSIDLRLRGDVTANALFFNNQVQIDVSEKVKL